MRTFEYQFDGRTFHMCMNANALFDIYDKFGNKSSIIDLFKGTEKKSFEATCWMLSKFAEQGELVRRFQGFKPERMNFSAEYFKANLRPLDVPKAKQALEDMLLKKTRKRSPM